MKKITKLNKMQLMLAVILVGVLAFLSLSSPVFANGQPEDLHCPDHESNPKFNVSGGSGTSTLSGVSVSVSGASVSFGQEVQFCVKAGDGASGKQTGTSFTVDWLNNGEQTPDISYVVVYEVIEEPEEPEEPKEERPFVRVTYICQANLAGIVEGYGLDVGPGDHVWRIRHESGPATSFTTNFLSDVQGSIGVGQTLYFVTQQSANGVKVITSPLENLYGGTASVSGAICEVPEEPEEPEEPKGGDLSVLGECEVDNVVWTITNENDTEITFTWQTNNGQSGQGSVLASSSKQIITNLAASSITVSYTLNNTPAEIQGNVEACSEDPKSTPTEPTQSSTPTPDPTDSSESKPQVDPKPDQAAGGSGPSLGSLITFLVVSGASVGIVSYVVTKNKKKENIIQ